MPQLLNTIEEDELEKYLTDDNWCMQEKFDGVRRMIIKKDGSIKGVNRKGFEVALPGTLQAEVAELPDCILDGEAIGDKLVVFDMIIQEPYSTRWNRLYHTVKGSDASVIQLVETAWDTYYKRQFFENLKKNNAEGIVFKNIRASYTPGRPASGGTQVKFKFTASASCMVIRINRTKRSIALGLFDDTDEIVDVGNVTVYPNQEIPRVMSVCEVKYLYAYEGGSLYQPVLLGPREDIRIDECLLSQLKYKKEDADA